MQLVCPIPRTYQHSLLSCNGLLRSDIVPMLDYPADGGRLSVNDKHIPLEEVLETEILM